MIKFRDKLKVIVSHNNNNYNYYKLAEELAELSEVVLKLANKTEGYKPSVEKLIEEGGDVLCRLHVVLEQHNCIDEAKNRCKQKLNSLILKVEKGLYKGEV